jgi:hypothetical protein
VLVLPRLEPTIEESKPRRGEDCRTVVWYDLAAFGLKVTVVGRRERLVRLRIERGRAIPPCRGPGITAAAALSGWLRRRPLRGRHAVGRQWSTVVARL